MNFPKDQDGVLPAALLAFFCAEDISAKGFAVGRVMVLDDEGLQKKRIHRNFREGLKGHADINRELSNPAYPAKPVVDAWLKGVFWGVARHDFTLKPFVLSLSKHAFGDIRQLQLQSALRQAQGKRF